MVPGCWFGDVSQIFRFPNYHLFFLGNHYWLVVSNISYFPFHTRDNHHPIDELIFFKMVKLHHQPVCFCWFPEPLANLHLPRNGVPADLLQWKPSKFLGCSGIPLQWSQCRIADSAPTKLRGWVYRISNRNYYEYLYLYFPTSEMGNQGDFTFCFLLGLVALSDR